MDDALYTLEEASRLTGMTAEALRKRFLRGQIEGVSSKESNDGRVRVRLTESQLSDLRRPDDQPDDEPPVHPPGGLPEATLMRLVDSLEARALRAEEAADRERLAVEAARAAHDGDRLRWDEERREWRGTLDAVASELAATRAGRLSDRKTAVAAVRRIRDQSAALRAQLDQVLAGQQQAAAPTPTRRPGFIARLFRRTST